MRINQPAWIVHKTLIGMSHLTCGLACLQGAEGLKAIVTNLCKQKYWGKTVKMLFGLCPYTSVRAVAPCAELSDFFFFSFFSPSFQSAWRGRPSPSAWARQSPPSTPTRRPSSSSGTNARPSSKAYERRAHERPSDISGNAPCTPSPNRWRFIPARLQKAAGKPPFLLTLWT